MKTRRSTRQKSSGFKAINYGLSDDEQVRAATSSSRVRGRRKSQDDGDGDFDAPEDEAADPEDDPSSDASVHDEDSDAAEFQAPARGSRGGATAGRGRARTRARGRGGRAAGGGGRRSGGLPPRQQHYEAASDPEPELEPEPKPTTTGPLERKPRGEWKGLTKRRTQAAHRASARGLPSAKRRGLPETDGEVWRYSADNVNKSLRVYAGTLQRHDRFGLLLATMFGPDPRAVAVADDLRHHFANFVLPARGRPRGPPDPDCVLPSQWLPPAFEADQRRAFADWYRAVLDDPAARQKAAPPAPAKRRRKMLLLLPRSPDGDLITFLGPHDSQRQVVIPQGEAISLSETWEPADEESPAQQQQQQQQPAGWLVDVGGIPLAMGWAPRREADADQILALAVAPFADHAFYWSEKDLPKDNSMTSGSVQLWSFTSELDEKGIRRPSRKPPRRASALCFNWGRPTRMEWCPIAASAEFKGFLGLMAVLCDGKVHVVEAREPAKDGETELDLIQKPMATLDPAEEEPGITATCFTWMDANHMALGCKDGTVSIWSIHPRMLLQRQTVHHVEVVEVRSGYPSQPYLVASVPLGGCPTLTDFTDPAVQTAAHTAPSANLQPNTLCWSEHLRGFVCLYANSTPGSTTVAFLGARYPSQPRTVFQGFSQPVSLATGAGHPYTLVGCADGSLWSFNTFHKVFYMRNEKLYKMKLFQHEYRRVKEEEEEEEKEEGGNKTAAAAAEETTPKIRGAVRFLHGFKPEVNDNPRNDYSRGMMKKAREKTKMQEAKRVAKRHGAVAAAAAAAAARDAQGGSADLVERNEEDDYPEDHNPIKGIILHEPETRVVTIAWNPNLDVGWWAAAAMGSGLLRVMDLGLE
ncbi:hypothetical protein RB594_000726 [Gaeumannomyces avenae]